MMQYSVGKYIVSQLNVQYLFYDIKKITHSIEWNKRIEEQDI